MSNKQQPIGVIAGRGYLPKQVIDSCAKENRPVYAVGFEGITDKRTLENAHHMWVSLGQVGKTIRYMQKHKVKQLVLAGGVGRPNFTTLKMDFTALRLLKKLTALTARGDNTVFSAVIAFLEERGFEVIGVDRILKNLVILQGPLGTVKPDWQAQKDIQLAKKAALTIGQLDIGQAVIVQQGTILGVEGAEGTDQLIKRCATLHAEGPGGVLVKMKKPGQDTRVDLPSIGVETIENAYHCGLRGIAVEAGGSLVIDRKAVAKKADSLGLFVVGIT